MVGKFQKNNANGHNGHICEKSGLIDNPDLENSNSEDFLFHLGINNKKTDLPKLYGDVKFVCMCGAAHRIKKFAEMVRDELYSTQAQEELTDLAISKHRYSMYKVGNVLCINHGMGSASVTIVLHEVIKLLHYAGVKDPLFFRMGTCGGLGVPAGTVIISEKVVNEFLEEEYEFMSLGKRVKLPALLNKHLVENLKNICSTKYPDIPMLSGKTMNVDHFYESFASTKASICENDDFDRNEYFDLLNKHRILGVDMEALAIAAITNRLGIKSAAIFTNMNNIYGSLADTPEETYAEWECRPLKIVLEYIRNSIQSSNK